MCSVCCPIVLAAVAGTHDSEMKWTVKIFQFSVLEVEVGVETHLFQTRNRYFHTVTVTRVRVAILRITELRIIYRIPVVVEVGVF